MTSTYPVIKGSLLSSDHYTWNTADSVGRGASAVVYLGRHKSQGTVVAVKVFHDHVGLGYKQDDLRELELLKKLDDPHIIHLLAIEKEISQQKTVLIMEYCEGGSLHHMLDQPPYFYGLPEAEYLLVLQHVSSGMKYLRDKKVIHRDIKPGNIMRYLSQEGFSMYKLTDFGAARSLDEDENFMSLYGTEEYLHPGIYERAVLKLPTAQSFDAKVDLWSLGVTFYHTATGQLPFQPYGGRQNRQTMFEIITQKDSGVISGIQKFQKGPIEWKRDLPETSPLSSGLRSIVVPLLAGLMEPNAARMISYDSFFQICDNVRHKATVSVFHFSRCEDLKVYADLSSTLVSLQDQIASLTDIPSSDQILLVGGHPLHHVVDPRAPLHTYPPRLLVDAIFLFQRDMGQQSRIHRPDLPPFQDFSPYSDMDTDSRLAHNCAAKGELLRRLQSCAQDQQQRLMDGLLYFRLYVEVQLQATHTYQETMKRTMEDCSTHVHLLFKMVRALKEVVERTHSKAGMDLLESVSEDTVIRQVHKKATERIVEIDNYRSGLSKKLDEVKVFASRVSAVCREEKCSDKVNHHMTMISSVLSRFRRDKSVKHQMTSHDENIHRFERQKLQMHCVTMKSIYTDHCLKQLETVYKSAMHTCESLTKCLSRVVKVDTNIKSVMNCQKLLIEKVEKLGQDIEQRFGKDSGFEEIESGQIGSGQVGSGQIGEVASWPAVGARLGVGEAAGPATFPARFARAQEVNGRDDGARSLFDSTLHLKNQLQSINDIMTGNMRLMKELESPIHSNDSSLSKGLEPPSYPPEAFSNIQLRQPQHVAISQGLMDNIVLHPDNRDLYNHMSNAGPQGNQQIFSSMQTAKAESSGHGIGDGVMYNQVLSEGQGGCYRGDQHHLQPQEYGQLHRHDQLQHESQRLGLEHYQDGRYHHDLNEGMANLGLEPSQQALQTRQQDEMYNMRMSNADNRDNIDERDDG